MNHIQLRNLREQIQENLRCTLDGAPEEMLDAACQTVVDTFKPFTKEEGPKIQVLYSDIAVIPTGSDYLVDLMMQDLDGISSGDLVFVQTEAILMWRNAYQTDDIKENEHRDRLYHYLSAVLNKFEEDEREEPAYILFTS